MAMYSAVKLPCRWRKLEGSDPTTYEMILKIQMLQKRLIVKTEEVVEKDLLIQVRGLGDVSLLRLVVQCPACSCRPACWG